MSDSSSAPLIDLKGVSKTFSSDGERPVEAIRDIEFRVNDGEFVAIVGRSGCGKSTLLRIIAGLISASEGHVTIDGQVVDGPRRDAGMVFQRPALLPWRTVLGNVLLPIEIIGKVGESDRQRALDLLELVGLEGFDDRAPRELSGGMQQRAAICRALMLRPSVLLMDEPFGALDALTREELALEVQRMWSEQGMTILFVTHSISEAVLLADRVIVMTPRPGQVAKQVDIDVPRPRSFTDHASSEQLMRYSERIRRLVFTKHLTPESAQEIDDNA